MILFLLLIYWQEDGIIHTEHYADDKNGPNSHINSNSLNTVTNEQKDKVSQKKKASIKPKDESSSSVTLVKKNENKVVNSSLTSWIILLLL
jgi:hypothetical protein